MFDTMRTVEDILEYTETHKINGKMIAIDFQKAFDSLSRNFIFQTLSVLNFGPPSHSGCIHFIIIFQAVF